MVNKFFSLKIISLEKEIFSDKVKSVYIKTTEGYNMLYPGHINYTAIIPTSNIKITDTIGNILNIKINEGYLTFIDNKAIIIYS